VPHRTQTGRIPSRSGGGFVGDPNDSTPTRSPGPRLSVIDAYRLGADHDILMDSDGLITAEIEGPRPNWHSAPGRSAVREGRRAESRSPFRSRNSGGS
jgi:hypothetical protein